MSRCVLAVVGASGGVGSSVLAAAVAVRARRAGLETVLVDGCPLGGGLDVTLGAEQQAGIRWGDLGQLVGSADGAALLGRLPTAEGLPVLAFGRDGSEPSEEVASAVVAALAEVGELVVVDVPSAGGTVARAALAEADRVLLVAGVGLRQLSALSVVAGLLAQGSGRPGVRMAVCLRGASGYGPVAEVVESELRWPVLGALGDDRRAAADLVHGVPPGSRSRGAVTHAADLVLAWAVLAERGAA